MFFLLEISLMPVCWILAFGIALERAWRDTARFYEIMDIVVKWEGR